MKSNKNYTIRLRNIVVYGFHGVHQEEKTLGQRFEIDLEYKELSEKLGIEEFHRIPVVGTHPEFIEGLYQIVINAIESNKSLISGATDDWKDG